MLWLKYMQCFFQSCICLLRTFLVGFWVSGFFFLSPFQLSKFTAGFLDLPPHSQTIAIAALGLQPSAAKGEERPFSFEEGTPTLPIYSISSSAASCFVAKSDLLWFFSSSLSSRAVLGSVGAGCRHSKIGSCPQHNLASAASWLCLVLSLWQSPGKPKEEPLLLVLMDWLRYGGWYMYCFFFQLVDASCTRPRDNKRCNKPNFVTLF